ncbi:MULTISPECIES: copper homeostasis protein CutC [Yersinia]|uniref:PF03932 family protein CutC n=1 Tax=Yersinia rochesterensis TaxID=1604335 RepID=A0A386HEB8_9GAMM|nr:MULTISPECIES: copper homeostasis protein CutC [Yersinia]AJI85516.1 copper homeostasis protein CutC [Yersinia frederiksenii Y225]CNH45269.1 copper homeostasis protein CutC [Yersinia kristensenii]AIN19148.1 cutC family protein [Yersinia rochesterensis]AJJ34892.1 cutC family protein [Yersinia rochesterensis]AYD43901.1 copper homeostasis protein CutC [Yersinia rochesterensis]
MTTLEICCYSVDCAQIAEKAGADRIELCCGQSEGGLTPSIGALMQVRETVTIPVHPIVRPRGGDFCYSHNDFATIKNDIARIRDMGFAGVVVGILDVDGHIDLPRMREIMSISGSLAVTFHRAFDMCQNPMIALQQLSDLNVARILTSGQQQNAELGLALLSNLVLATQNQGPIIMAGAGVRTANIQKFIDIGIRELHSSAGRTVPSTMKYRKAGVTMCADSDVDEFAHYCVDGEVVKDMKNLLEMMRVPLSQPA